VLDEWALRFFGEMDYQQEAHNTAIFKQQMAHLEGKELDRHCMPIEDAEGVMPMYPFQGNNKK
jgi:hypothetical protein